MRFGLRALLGLGLLVSGGCQLLAGLEERSELPADNGAGGETDGGAGGAAGGGTAGQDSAGQAGSGFPGGNAGAGQGGAGEGGSGGVALARPPPRVGDPVPSKTKDPKVFIVKNIDFGYRDSNGDLLPKEKMGKSIGFDFDGKCTIEGDVTTRGCKSTLSNPLFSSQGFFDGDGCLDNLYGGSIFPALGSVKSTFDQELNFSIESEGAPTLLFEIEDLDEGPNDAYAPASLYVAAQIIKGPPNWNLPQPRILDAESVNVVDAQGNPCKVDFNPQNNVGIAPDGCKPVAKLRFPNGYVANNTWVSGPFVPEEGIVEPSKSSLILGGIKLDADLQAVLVSFQFTSEKHEKVLKGTYGAVLSAKSLKGALPEFLGKFCIPTNFLGTDLVQLISSTTDIMSTPPFSADSNVDCDALTIGMGFTVLPSRIDGNKLPNGEFKPYIGNSLPINPCGGGAGGAAGQANGGSAGGGGASSGNGGFGG